MAGLLYIGKVWPEPASSAAGLRTVQLLEFFSGHFGEVHFASVNGPGDNGIDLSGKNVGVISVTLNDPSFDEMIASLQPEVVVFDRFTTEEQFGWRVAAVCPAALRILDTQDLHGLREARRLALDSGGTADDHLANDVAFREVASIYRCDLSLIISEAEMTVLLTSLQVPARLLIYTPFLFDPIDEAAKSEWKKFDERKDFVFIGNFRHAPNADGAGFLKSAVWPLIRSRIGEARVKIYGAYAPREIASLHDPANGFYVMGRAKSAEEVLSAARVSLAPLRFGAGLKGKIAESWRQGTPCVATAIAAEGLSSAPWGGAIVDDVQQFAEMCVRLHEDRQLWDVSQTACATNHNAVFCATDHKRALADRVTAINEEPEFFRKKNFTGAMIRQQQYYAARWLGKYIETKSRLHATDPET